MWVVGVIPSHHLRLLNNNKLVESSGLEEARGSRAANHQPVGLCNWHANGLAELLGKQQSRGGASQGSLLLMLLGWQQGRMEKCWESKQEGMAVVSGLMLMVANLGVWQWQQSAKPIGGGWNG